MSICVRCVNKHISNAIIQLQKMDIKIKYKNKEQLVVFFPLSTPVFPAIQTGCDDLVCIVPGCWLS